MVTDTASVVKEVSRKAKQSDLSREEQELKHELEESAKGTPKPWLSEQEARAGLAPQEGVAITVPQNAKIVVSDLSRQYGIPGSLILIFTDPKSGRTHPYVTKEAMGIVLERKGYSRLAIEKTGAKHDPANLKFHFIAELTPIIPEKALRALEVLKDVDRQEFLNEYRKLTTPITDDGFASPDTVRMSTMKTAYNLERLAKTRAYRHVASLYTGCGFGVMPRSLESDVEEMEAAGVLPTPEASA